MFFLCSDAVRCECIALVVVEQLDGNAGQDASRQKNTSLKSADSAALKGELFSPQTHETSPFSPISLRLMSYSPVIKTEIGHYYIKCSHFAVSSVH